MAPVLSKFTKLPFNCYELGHTWTHSCTHASTDLGFNVFKESLKIYSTCYIISLLAIPSKRKLLLNKTKNVELLKQVGLDIFRSSVFLTMNGFLFIHFFCLIRKVLGHFNFYTIGFLPTFLAAYCAIQVEKKSRRPLLAVYVTNVATETLYRMIRKRGLIRNVKNFDLFLFTFSSAVILYQMKRKNLEYIAAQSGGESSDSNKRISHDFVESIFSKLIGKEEFNINIENQMEFMQQQEENLMQQRISEERGRYLNDLNQFVQNVQNQRPRSSRESLNIENLPLNHQERIFNPERLEDVPVIIDEEEDDDNEQNNDNDRNQNANVANNANGQNNAIRRRERREQNLNTFKGRFVHFVLWMHGAVEDIACHLERMVNGVYSQESGIHELCPHKKIPCLNYWIEGFTTRLGFGFTVQYLIDILLLIKSKLSAPSKLNISNKSSQLFLKMFSRELILKSFKTGLGLSSVCFGYRLLSCSFRWLQGTDYPINSFLSSLMGTILGFLLIKPPSTIALYLFFKALVSYFQDVHRKKEFKFIKLLNEKIPGGGWTLLYAFSTSVLFHAGMMEPQNLKPSYFNFLSKVTGRKFYDINRHLFTIYGTNPNQLLFKYSNSGEFWWPKLIGKYLSKDMVEVCRQKIKTFDGQGRHDFDQTILDSIIRRVLFSQ